MIRIIVPVAMAAALCLSTYATADQAGQGRGTEEEQKSCTPDVYRLCSTEIPDEKRIVACLRLNRSKLSAPCRKVFS